MISPFLLYLYRFEGGGDGAIPGESLTDCPTLEKKETFNLQETCQWFECILAALDCYIWVFDNDLLTSAEMFVGWLTDLILSFFLLT